MRIAALALSTALLLPAAAIARDKRDKQLQEAVQTLDELGKHVPAHIRKRARCVSVLKMAKGGFIVGGTGGSGFLSCRAEGGQDWSAPAVLAVGGPSAGAQIGGSSTRVVMVFINVDDMDAVTHATPTFSGKVDATAGDASQSIAAGGNPELAGSAYSVARSEGLYAGAVGEALVIEPNVDATADLYGGKQSIRALLVERSVAVPEVARAFTRALADFAK